MLLRLRHSLYGWCRSHRFAAPEQPTFLVLKEDNQIWCVSYMDRVPRLRKIGTINGRPIWQQPHTS